MVMKLWQAYLVAAGVTTTFGLRLAPMPAANAPPFETKLIHKPKHTPSDSNTSMNQFQIPPSSWQVEKRDSKKKKKSTSKNGDSGFAVCLVGLKGGYNVSEALRKFVIGPLNADLFVVSPENRTSLQEFEPFVGDVEEDSNVESAVGRTKHGDSDVEAYFDNISNDWRSAIQQIGGNWFAPLTGGGSGAHQAIDQNKCHELIKAAEASRGHRYERIIASRLDFMWLQPHPHKDKAGCWIPCPGNDWGGVCDHHASCDRDSAEVYLSGKVASVVDPVERAAMIAAAKSLNTEGHLMWVLNYKHVPVSRSQVAAFRSCKPDNPKCMYIEALGMWGKPSGSELNETITLNDELMHKKRS